MSEKLINVVKMCVEGLKGKEKIEWEYTEDVDINTKVRQGEGLSNLYFLTYPWRKL